MPSSWSREPRHGQVHGGIKKISPETVQQIRQGYLFLDWFAIPQRPGEENHGKSWENHGKSWENGGFMGFERLLKMR